MNELGQTLRTRREERGLTLKEVEQALNIRVKYLQAIEEENYQLIPGEVYVKGFLRNYASYLGLNGEEFVQRYKDAKQPPATVAQLDKKEERPNFEVKAPGSNRIIYWGLAIGIVGAGYFGYNQFSQPSTPKVSNPPPISSTPVPGASQQTPPPGTAQPPQTTPVIQGVKVDAKITAKCWVQVLADGREIFEGVLKQGDIATWEAKTTMEITLGNAGGVELTVNGQPQGALGKSGDVVNKVYKAQGL
jgi:cytoskeletal protein RodZ